MSTSTSNSCPRCRGERTETQYQGKEAGQVIWSVLHCQQCSFSWRDSEPPESISPAKRDPFFNVNPEEVKRYPIVLPPMA
ncbi:MAG: hypothetical protein IVW54_00260 [Candidatus Binataceae bacterium]|nr:hypothetical protein [Candidatus Binataceae bacterium]